MDESKNIILWGGWYGSRNVGDQLLLLSITDLIEDSLPGAHTYYVLTDDAAWVKGYTARESRCSFEAVQSKKELPRLISILKRGDLFVLGGGVPFFDQPRQVLVMSFLVFWLRFFRVPYMAWAVGSQEIRSWYAVLAYRYILKWMSLVTCRDLVTRDRFEKLTHRSKPIHLVSDSGFSLDYDLTKGKEILRRNGWQDSGRSLAALTPRKLRMPDGEAETHYRLQRRDDYLREVASFSAALDWLWEQGYQPVFVPMNTIEPDNDLQAAQDIIAHAKHGESALMVNEILRPREVPGIYANCDLSYVARVHGSITSFLANTPMMMFAFASKHQGIMEAMGMKEYALQSHDVSVEHTIQKLESLINNGDALRSSMAARLEILRKTSKLPADLMLDTIFNL